MLLLLSLYHSSTAQHITSACRSISTVHPGSPLAPLPAMQPVPVSLPAVPLDANSDMVDVRRLSLSWAVFSACCVAYRSSVQWKRNRERLARHKLDHRLSGLSEQQVYEHYMATVQPRATRSDAGRQRSSSTRETGTDWRRFEEQLDQSTSVAPIPSPHSGSPVLDTQSSRASSAVGSSNRMTAQRPFSVTVKRARASAAPLLDQHSSISSATLPPQQAAAEPTSPPSPHPSSLSQPAPVSPSAMSRLQLEVDRLHRTLDMVSATIMEGQDRQDERNRRVEAELAELKRALQTQPYSEQSAAVASVPPTVEPSAVNSQQQPSKQPSTSSMPTVASSVPSSILDLLRSDSFQHEAQATPLGVNNVLWGYAMTDPGGARSCESSRSIREGLRKESCMQGLRWDDGLLSEYDALVRQQDGQDVPVDGPRFLQWKARVSHSAICIFHESRPHEMLNPLYLNILSRVLYCSNDGVYIALLPCTTAATTEPASVRDNVRLHLANLFRGDEKENMEVEHAQTQLSAEGRSDMIYAVP